MKKSKVVWEVKDGFAEEVLVALCEVDGCDNPATVTVKLEDGELMFVCAGCIDPD
jgi:hypothetical protein